MRKTFIYIFLTSYCIVHFYMAHGKNGGDQTYTRKVLEVGTNEEDILI